MTIVVTGGRDYADVAAVYRALDAAHAKRPITLLIEGGATGADAIARAWARDRKVTYKTMEADWKKHGKAAGPIRNREMLAMKPEGVVAFPGGAGTRDCVEAARALGIMVWEPLKEKPRR